MARYHGSYAEYHAKRYLRDKSWPSHGVKPIDTWYDIHYYGRINENQEAAEADQDGIWVVDKEEEVQS